MADVFSNAPEDGEDDQTPGIRVAGTLTGDGEAAPEEEDSPQVEQPQGTVDTAAQSYTVPAEADEGESEPPQASDGDVPVSADTKAYMTPIAPPTLAKPADYSDHSGTQAQMVAQKAAEAGENVKPSIGRRIIAAIAGGATGFGSGGQAGANVEREVLNRPRTNAEARWATQEAPIQAQQRADQATDAATRNANVNTEQSNRLAEQQYGLQERGQIDAARAQNFAAIAAAKNEGINGDGWKRDNKDDPDGSYTGTSIGGKTIHSSTAPASVRLDPEYKIDSASAAGHPYTTEQQQIIRSGGKLTFRPPPNPRQPTEGEVSLRDATAAFTKEHGRPPQTLDEQNQVTQAAKGTLGKGGSAPTIAGFDNLLKQRTADYNLWQKNYNAESITAKTPSQKAAVEAKYAGQQNDLQAKWNQTLSDYDPNGTLQHGGAPQQTSPAGVAPPPISPAAPPHPATHTFSVAAWQKANPKGDANAAKAAATQQGFRVVP